MNTSNPSTVHIPLRRPSLLPALVQLLVPVLVLGACTEPEPLVLLPLPPGVALVARSSTDAPLPGLLPALARTRVAVADGVARGFVAANDELARRERLARRDRRAAETRPDRRCVDLNADSRSRLQRLPGIGPALSERIVASRPYDSPEALLSVSGIGPATLERLRPHVCPL